MNRKRVKQYLMLLLAIGVVAVVASGSGTFASFQAETQNDNNTFATGTLFLHNTHGVTTCTSESGSGNLQVSPSCATLFSVTNLAPSVNSTADLTLTNAGSVNSANIKWDRPAVCQNSAATLGTLGQAEDDTSLTLHVTGLTQTVVSGSKIKLDDGSQSAIFTVTTTTNAATAASSGIPVTNDSATSPGHSFTPGSTAVTFSLAFTTTPTLCTQLLLSIDEVDPTTSAEIGCVYPTVTTGIACVTTSGTALNALPNTLTALGSDPLNAAQSRKFVINVQAPASLGNADMSTQAKFSLLWHLEH